MAEYRVPTQAEIDRLLYMQGLSGKTNQQIIDENLARGTTIQSLPESLFTTASAGARRAGNFVNQLGSAETIAKLFPGYMGTSKVTIPTGFNFAPKQMGSGEVLPQGLQTQSVPVASILQAIKPADVLGISGAERAYGDIGAGKAPQPLDVVDTLGVGAVGLGATSGLLRATKGLPVGLGIQEAKGLLQTAPKSDIGFYSAVEQAAMATPRKSGAGQAFLNDIIKGQDVRADEIKWMGLDDYLKGKQNVTKQEVQDYIANNRVNVQEVQLGGAQPYNAQRLSQLESEYKTLKQHPIDDPSFGEEKYNELIRLTNIRDQSTTQTLYDSAEIAMQNAQRAQRQGNNLIAEKYFREAEFFNTRAEKLDLEGQGMSNPPKFGQYQLPGGENYRELLLTMPNIKGGGLTAPELERLNTLVDKRIGSSLAGLNDAEQKEYFSLIKKREESASGYKSSHFPDQRNILAHLRVNDRIDADGKKMLLIEEVQSDWHQAGRGEGYGLKKRYAVEDQDGRIVDTFDNKLEAEKVAATRRYNKVIEYGFKGVPDAPFKDTWYQLALKRAIQHAAENGYDRIGLTTGSQQAKRFDLSQQIGQINARPTPDGKISLEAMTPDMRSQVFNKVVNADELVGIVGKEIAEKIKNQIEYPKSFDDRGKSVELTGLDLQVGGEGMKKYYDEIYPKFLDKYGKKWGAKVGETKVNTVMERAENSMIPTMGQEGVRYLDITPEMKAGVSKGQPLFAAVPAIPAAGLLAPQERR